MFATTVKSVSMILGVALVAAAASASADETSLASAENAAQSAIVGTAGAPVTIDASSATLTRNEHLAQRVFVDVSTSASTRTGAADATLAQNEIAAQRAIADMSSAQSPHSAGAATHIASMRSPAAR